MFKTQNERLVWEILLLMKSCEIKSKIFQDKRKIIEKRLFVSEKTIACFSKSITPRGW